jgi:alkylhydroperoxidase/carboxymuconolactone decarboxylase family protein YurZ
LPGQSATSPETRAERSLAVQKQIVKGHVRANLNVGNDRATMLAVTQLLPFVGYPPTLNALRALDEITR